MGDWATVYFIHCKSMLDSSQILAFISQQILADEQQALQLAFTKLEEKFRKMQEDNNDLVTRWMQLKSQAADKVMGRNSSSFVLNPYPTVPVYQWDNMQIS